MARADIGKLTAAPAAPTLEAIYRTEVAWVVHTLRRLGVPELELDDCAHDLFVVVHRKLPEFDARKPLRPWLFGIAFRIASERRKRFGRRHTAQTAATIELVGPSQPSDETRAHDALAVVVTLLARLKPIPRAVLVMHEMEGWSIREIAEVLGLRPNSAYSHLHRARRAINQAAAELGLRGGAS
jgi:RNA polymerase sigma-70 factor, ECF subfamily